MEGKPGTEADGWLIRQSPDVRAIWLVVDGWLGRPPPEPLSQIKDGVRHGFKVSRFPDFWPYWEDGHAPLESLTCARVPLGMEFGSYPLFSLHP